MPSPELQTLLSKIAELFDAEYQRGETAAIARYERALNAARGGQTLGSQADAAKSRSEAQRNRVARGVPEAFVRRVLALASLQGVTPKEVLGMAETDEEKSISYSAIRTTMHRGVEQGWAIYGNGKWFLRLDEPQEVKN